VSSDDAGLTLAEGLLRSRFDPEQLWLEYVALGGNAGKLEVEAYTLGVLAPDPYQHNLIAQALNEHFLPLGQDHPVAYKEVAENDY
jgi:hypothetical protein